MAVNFDVWGDLVQGEIEWFKKGQMECRLAKWFLVSEARDWRKLSFACSDILKILSNFLYAYAMGHGQPSMKRGFNDKNVVLKYWWERSLLIARRNIKIIFSAIEPYTIQIKNELLKSIKYARRRRRTLLPKKKKRMKSFCWSKQWVCRLSHSTMLRVGCIKKLDASFVTWKKQKKRT